MWFNDDSISPLTFIGIGRATVEGEYWLGKKKEVKQESFSTVWNGVCYNELGIFISWDVFFDKKRNINWEKGTNISLVA